MVPSGGAEIVIFIFIFISIFISTFGAALRLTSVIKPQQQAYDDQMAGQGGGSWAYSIMLPCLHANHAKEIFLGDPRPSCQSRSFIRSAHLPTAVAHLAPMSEAVIEPQSCGTAEPQNQMLALVSTAREETHA